jgi:hypothetical protein
LVTRISKQFLAAPKICGAWCIHINARGMRGFELIIPAKTSAPEGQERQCNCKSSTLPVTSRGETEQREERIIPSLSRFYYRETHHEESLIDESLKNGSFGQMPLWIFITTCSICSEAKSIMNCKQTQVFIKIANKRGGDDQGVRRVVRS